MLFKNLIIINGNFKKLEIQSTGSSLRDHIPKRKKVKENMRKDLVFRYLNSIETAIRRMESQLTHDSYTNLAGGQTSFFELSDTELEFMIEHLSQSIHHSNEILSKLKQEHRERNQTQ